jgi:tRNA(fMet)-specific endonuclease VapC
VVNVAERPVLDTDVLIDYLRGAGPGVSLMRTLAPTLAYRVTAIAAFELSLSPAYARDPKAVHALLAVECLPLRRSAALQAGALLGGLRLLNRAIELRDALQAGICLEAGATLVTGDAARYARVPGLRVIAPTDA